MSDEKKLTEREAAIRLKQIAGLSREQAEAVVASQEAHDAELAKAETEAETPEEKAARKLAEKEAKAAAKAGDKK
jgi:hypothetical protein